jgi:hypothetical protein
VEEISLNHRMRGSQGYRRAAELILSRLGEAGLAEASIIALPADGRIFYGTQRSRPPGTRISPSSGSSGRRTGRRVDAERIASWKDQPITLAQDSISGTADAALVDVGAGSAESDYAGTDFRGKLVLTSSQPGEIASLAVTKYGAAGIVSWAQNQKQAWWGEDETLIRWGHLDTWKDPTFAFMVSPARAHSWQERLRKGETVRLRANVTAGRSPGQYLIPTAVIPGRDRTKEIVYSCHLDHPSPGANDNASGCAGILEVARSLNRLVKEGRLPQPERTLRFIWPCEVECTISLLNARPEFAARTLATIHLDMIGGRTDTTKGILRVEGSPPSSPSFVDDVAFALTRWVNAQSFAFADSRFRRLAADRPRRRQGGASGQGRRLLGRQRPRDLGRRQLAHPDHLRVRLAGPLHPHQPRRPGKPRRDEDEAGNLHRRGIGLVPRQRPGKRGSAARARYDRRESGKAGGRFSLLEPSGHAVRGPGGNGRESIPCEVRAGTE